MVEIDQAQGQTYCAGCGIVLEENTIVSEVTFGESSTGAAVLQGSYVGADAGQSVHTLFSLVLPSPPFFLFPFRFLFLLLFLFLFLEGGSSSGLALPLCSSQRSNILTLSFYLFSSSKSSRSRRSTRWWLPRISREHPLQRFVHPPSSSRLTPLKYSFFFPFFKNQVESESNKSPKVSSYPSGSPTPPSDGSTSPCRQTLQKGGRRAMWSLVVCM